MKSKLVSKKYVKEYKKETFFMALSIVIGAALFFFSNILTNEIKHLEINQAKSQDGAYHVSYYFPSTNEIDRIKNLKGISDISTSMLLGISDVGEGKTLQIVYDDEKMREIKPAYKILKGSMPKDYGEIAIDSNYLESIKLENPIGKTIEIKYTGHDKDGNEIFQDTQKFKITGITSSNPILKAQGSFLATVSKKSIEKLSPLDNNISQIAFTYLDSNGIYEQTQEIIDQLSIDESRVRYNEQLLSSYEMANGLNSPYLVINILILIAITMLIYNIVCTGISNKIKDFGTMNALGISTKDVLKILFGQIYQITIISLPIGLVCGALLSRLSTWYIIESLFASQFETSIEIMDYVKSALYSTLLIVTSISISFIPLWYKLTKLDAIEIIRSVNSPLNIKNKTIFSNIIKSLFGDYTYIAYRNIQRNRKRTTFTIIAISITLVTIISVYTESSSSILNDDGLRKWIPGDFSINNINIATINENNVSFDDNMMNEIKKIKGVKEVVPSRNKSFNITLPEDNIDKNSSYWNENEEILRMREEKKDGKLLYKHSFEVLGSNDFNSINNVIVEGFENVSLMKSKPLIFIDKNSSENLNLNVGDEVKLSFDEIDPQTNENIDFIEKDFIVGGVIKENILVSQGGGTTFSAVISIDQFNKFFGVSSFERFDIWGDKDSNGNYIEDKLQEILDTGGVGTLTNFELESKAIEKSNSNRMVLILFLASLVTITTIFYCNNTILNSINDRIKEFSVLKAIGFNDNEINKIVGCEMDIYFVLSIGIAIIPIITVRKFLIEDLPSIKIINLEFVVFTLITLLIVYMTIKLTSSKYLNNINKEEFSDKIKTIY